MYLLAKIGADTAENERNFAEILRKIGNYPTGQRDGLRVKLRELAADLRRRSADLSPSVPASFDDCKVLANKISRHLPVFDWISADTSSSQRIVWQRIGEEVTIIVVRSETIRLRHKETEESDVKIRFPNFFCCIMIYYDLPMLKWSMSLLEYSNVENITAIINMQLLDMSFGEDAQLLAG